MLCQQYPVSFITGLPSYSLCTISVWIGLTDTRAKSFYYFTNEKRYKSKIQKTKLVFCQEIRASANIVVGGEEGWSARDNYYGRLQKLLKQTSQQGNDCMETVPENSSEYVHSAFILA